MQQRCGPPVFVQQMHRWHLRRLHHGGALQAGSILHANPGRHEVRAQWNSRHPWSIAGVPSLHTILPHTPEFHQVASADLWVASATWSFPPAISVGSCRMAGSNGLFRVAARRLVGSARPCLRHVSGWHHPC